MPNSGMDQVLTVQFSAGQAVSENGKLSGVTVAEVGIATGHFCYIDVAGKVLGVGGLEDAPKFGQAKRLPLGMDQVSLQTIVAAVPKNKKVKTREDHSDAIAARAGYASGFRIEGDKCICDLEIYDNYANRALFLETATKTPEEIGLSGDFKFGVDIKDGVALMRVKKVDAVDIVDRGALTHAGLFKAKTVDTPAPTNLRATMAKHQEPDGDEMPDMGAFKTMCEAVAAYRAKHAEFNTAVDEAMAAISPVSVATPPNAPAPVSKSDNPDAKVPGADPKISASMKPEELETISTQLAAKMEAVVKAQVEAGMKSATVELQKQFSALGIKPSAAPAAPAAADTPKTTSDAPKDFLSLKASVAKERKISPAEAARVVMKENPESYHTYQVKLGILKA